MADGNRDMVSVGSVLSTVAVVNENVKLPTKLKSGRRTNGTSSRQSKSTKLRTKSRKTSSKSKSKSKKIKFNNKTKSKSKSRKTPAQSYKSYLSHKKKVQHTLKSLTSSDNIQKTRRLRTSLGRVEDRLSSCVTPSMQKKLAIQKQKLLLKIKLINRNTKI